LASRPLLAPLGGLGRASAVLVPLFEQEGEVRVWLVRRSEGLRSHGGQVSFPGGKVDPEDASPLDAALREASEEIGLLRGSVDVLGRLEDFQTMTGFTIAPFVGWLEAPGAVTGREAWQPVPNPAEVARVFAPPLRRFMDRPRGIGPFGGYDVDGEFVWGATAAMLRKLAGLL
jgi:8-oxo-dGTP pyrophosphatase MutT (NUDIX family)